MASRAKTADPYTWVRTAASKEAYRPILTGLETSDQGATVCATNGHALHTVAFRSHPHNGPEGSTVTTATGAPIEGTFPSWRNILPTPADGDLVMIIDVEAARPIVAAAAAAAKLAGPGVYHVTMAAPTTTVKPAPYSGNRTVHTGDRIYLDPSYVLSALDGMRRPDSLLGVMVRVQSSLKPAVLTADMPQDTRTALIMPVRIPDGATVDSADRFSLDAFTIPATAADALQAMAKVGKAAAESCAA